MPATQKEVFVRGMSEFCKREYVELGMATYLDENGSFSAFLFCVFVISEKITHRQRGAEHHEMREEFRVAEQPLIDREEMKVRPGNVLVAEVDGRPTPTYGNDRIVPVSAVNGDPDDPRVLKQWAKFIVKDYLEHPPLQALS